MTNKGPQQFVEVNGVLIPTEQYVANRERLDANRKVDLKAEPKAHIGIKSIREQVRLGMPTEPVYVRPGEDPVEVVRSIHKAMQEQPKQEVEVVEPEATIEEEVEDVVAEDVATPEEAEEVKAPVKKRATTFGKKK